MRKTNAVIASHIKAYYNQSKIEQNEYHSDANILFSDEDIQAEELKISLVAGSNKKENKPRQKLLSLLSGLQEEEQAVPSFEDEWKNEISVRIVSKKLKGKSADDSYLELEVYVDHPQSDSFVSINMHENGKSKNYLYYLWCFLFFYSINFYFFPRY